MAIRNVLFIGSMILSLMLGFQNCAEYETKNTMQSQESASEAPTVAPLNQLPGIHDIYQPDGGEVDIDQVPEGSVDTLVDKGLISTTSLQAVNAFRNSKPYIRPNPEKNSCDIYPVMAFNGKRESDCGEQYIESVNTRINKRDREAYIFTMYNATNDSHGPNQPRHIVEMPIHIPSGSKPIDLYLKSYEPTSWKLVGAVDRVKSVSAFGYHCQMVIGATDDTKIHVSSYEQGYSDFHRQLSELAKTGDTDFLFILRVFVSSDMARMFYSYDRQCLGDFIASP